MRNEQKFLNEIYEKRKKYTDAVRENEFEEGILSLLSELYPDEAHFIFELLQNAEDAGASKVTFELMPDFLRATHDGKRVFSRKDVEGITSIAKSPKREDVNQIGKFGIGFKAVFSYTKTPRVYSGGFNFEIRDLVCPHQIFPIDQNPHETIFIFPFNNPEKEPEICIKEIQSVFEKADETFLLFLNNIQSIFWKINVGNHYQGSVESEKVDQNLIKISLNNSDYKNKKFFLRYHKAIPGHGNLKCNVAFQVERKKGQQKIIPSKGRLCIFFPADKENTGLRFHINGPYASSIDRASIKHKDIGNRGILNTTAELLVESLADIKKRGLLGLDVLEVLPNIDDPLADFFAEIRTHLFKALKTEPLVPARDGGFCPSKDLVYGPKLLSDCISDEQMGYLSENVGKRWAIGAMRNSRAHKLLSSLDIPTWDESDFINSIENRFDKYDCYWQFKMEDGLRWLASQEDQWIVDFYLLLRRILKSKDIECQARDWKIIRSLEGHHYGSEVYFDTEGNSESFDLPIVKNALFAGLSPDRKKKLLEFLSLAGVREIGEQQAIERILEKHYPSNISKIFISRSTHIKHMRRFVNYYSKSHDVKLFRDHPILRTSDPDDEYCYKYSTHFLDEPFLKTNLSYLYENENSPLHNKKWGLWIEYKPIRGFVDFVLALGVVNSLGIKNTRATKREGKRWYDARKNGGLLEYYNDRNTYYRVNVDHKIDELEEIFKKPDLNVSMLIWQTMIKAEEKVLTAHYRPNKSRVIRIAPSSLVLDLQENVWVPTKNGEFKKPCDVDRKQLAKGFSLDDSTGWLKAIGFGLKQDEESQKEKEKLAFIKSFGLTKKSYSLALKVAGNPDLLAQLEEIVERETNKPEFPQRPSSNPGRRAGKAREAVNGAPEKVYTKKELSKRTSSGAVDKRKYLIEKYTNDDNQMVCQICKKEMPFRLPNGEYYFEAVEAVKAGSKEHPSNFLALCPLCSAKYTEWIKKVPNATELFGERVFEQDDLDIPIEMDYKPYTVSFVEQHLIDFKAYLEEGTMMHRT